MKKNLGAKTLLYPLPVWVVGTYDKDGKPNAMTASWGGMCCSKPPCAAISLREATHTYHNIIEQKAFTINVPSDKFVKQVDYFGLVSGKDTDKFEATGLTPIKSNKVNAPYIDEFPLAAECQLLNVVEIGVHTQFIGEIINVKIGKKSINNKGRVEISRIKPFIYDPANMTYYSIGLSAGRAFHSGKELNA